MKKFIKFIAGFCAFAALTTGLHAQLSVQTTSLNGGTANVAASTTNSVTVPVLTVAKASNVAIQAAFKLTGAGTSAVVFNFDESIDGSNWKTSSRTLSVTPAGTSTVVNLGNYTLGGAAFLRLSSVQNPNSAAITNLVLNYAYKTGL